MASTATYSTAGTVSSPLDLDAVKGEHQSVNVSGSRRKTVTPKVKVTLTSLTPNNVSAYHFFFRVHSCLHCVA